MTHPTVALIIPTYQAGRDIAALFAGITQQTHQPDVILVIDSSSTDDTLEQVKLYSAITHIIPKAEFNHGETRQLATTLVNADIYIFLTQDATPANANTFANIIKPFADDPLIGCVYGNQLAKQDATPLSAHARTFNYPAISRTMTLADKQRYKIKTCFNSDSFAAYRKEALDLIGGFKRTMMCEDMYVAAKMLIHGLKIHYNADACVYHSHNFSLKQEFQRYLAIGQFHQQESWIRETFGSAASEGWKFILSELHYLIRHKKPLWIPRAFASTISKYVGFKLGLKAPCQQ